MEMEMETETKQEQEQGDVSQDERGAKLCALYILAPAR